MGCGWLITWTSGATTSGQRTFPARGSNSNNVAEYLAVQCGLEAYHTAHGTGPLTVLSDSQLIVNQLNGAYRINQPPLARHASDVLRLVAPLDVTFAWIPREQNRAADLLAGGDSDPMPRLFVPQDALYEVAPALHRHIAALNQLTKPGFKEMLALRVGGRDALSALTYPALRSRAGEAISSAVAEAFGDDEQAQAVALRWALRGLGLDLAIRKVRVDAEVAVNAGRRRRRSRT